MRHTEETSSAGGGTNQNIPDRRRERRRGGRRRRRQGSDDADNRQGGREAHSQESRKVGDPSRGGGWAPSRPDDDPEISPRSLWATLVQLVAQAPVGRVHGDICSASGGGFFGEVNPCDDG